MQQFDVRGMSCAACSARIEKAVAKVEGVTACSVSLLTNSMGVEGDVSASEIIRAVEGAGYGASVKGEANKSVGGELKDSETPRLVKRLIASAVTLIILMYFSMGNMMWGWPVPKAIDNPVSLGLVQLLLCAVVMIINRKFFISGAKGVLHRAPNMDTLVALGSFVSFLYSAVMLFKAAYHMSAGDMSAAGMCVHEYYFESAAMILTLITVGKTLEAYSKGRTTDALKSLMALAPETAVLLRDGKEITVPISEVKTGDVFVVRPGENIPVDGVVIKGGGAVNESALTGESIPVDKAEGDTVSAATSDLSGFLTCRATRVGEDTTLSQIIKTVEGAAASKAPIAKVADKVSGVFVPVVIGISLVTFIIWMCVGSAFGYALARGISVLVISCPCALGLATPVAIMVGSGKAAKNGILFKTAASLEHSGRIAVVALDKTGTVTKGEPSVTDVVPVGNTESELVELCYSLEVKSEHPLAKAIVSYAEELGIKPREVDDFEALAGNGLKATLEGVELVGGSLKFVSSLANVTKEVADRADRLAEEGKTPLLFARDGALIGLVAVADVIKDDSASAIAELKNMGIRVVMITGDNERTASAVGKLAGVDEVIAGVLPSGKADEVNKLKKYGPVAMVGDGINDAPALTAADVGIAIGAGADIAIDAADAVLVNGKLSDVTAAIRLGRRTLLNIYENLFWAFIYNIIGIPLAAGAFIALFGWELQPMFGAAAMSLSSFCVIMNALRLNLVDIRNPKHDRRRNTKKKGINGLDDPISTETAAPEQIRKTIKIDGMMCGHCEAAVKTALEKIDGVTSASASYEKGEAVVTLSKQVSDKELTDAIEKEDYTVVAVGEV